MSDVPIKDIIDRFEKKIIDYRNEYQLNIASSRILIQTKFKEAIKMEFDIV